MPNLFVFPGFIGALSFFPFFLKKNCQHTPFLPYAAPLFPHMSDINSPFPFFHIGALSLHLASRLDAAFRAWRGGGTPPGGGSSASLPQPAGAAPDGCHLLNDGGAALELPPFPEFPAYFELPSVVPLPR